MKSKLLLSILAAIPAALMPLAANCQIAPDKAPSEITGPSYKYVAFAGWGYTSLNQVNQSRNGVQGVSLGLTRNWGKYFGLTAEGGHYAWTISSSNAVVGNPTVDLYLLGPELHAQLYDKLGFLVHGLIGAAHTGNVTISPSESLAGGVGGGLEYSLSPRIALRLTGDDIASSFTVVPYSSGDSPHMRWNARASFVVAYRF